MSKKQQRGVSGNPARAAAQRSGAEPIPDRGTGSGKGAGSGPGKGAGKGAGAGPDRAGRKPTGSGPAAGAATSPARARFERASAPVILFLNRLPRWVFPVGMGLLLLAGMLVPSTLVGGLLLVLLVVALGWLLALSWPLLGTPQRVLRLLVVVGIALIAYGRFTGRFG